MSAVADSSHRIKRPARWDQPFGGGLNQEDLQTILEKPPFCMVEGEKFSPQRPYEALLKNDGRLLRCKPGEIITRLGDYGSSCFLLLSGKLRVILVESTQAQALGARSTKQMGLWGGVSQLWKNSKFAERRNTALYRTQHGANLDSNGRLVQFVHDLPSLLRDSRTQTLLAGSFFGEVAPLSRSTRAATIFAESDAVLYELRWQGLRDIRRWDSSFRFWIDELFRSRSFLPLIAENPLFACLDHDTLAEVAQTASFESFGEQAWHKKLGKVREKVAGQAQGGEPVIIRQGDYQDGLLLIRGGFARVAEEYGHTERTVGYLSGNEMLGLNTLVSHSINSKIPLVARRSVYAVGYVDVLRIPTHVVLEKLIPLWQEMDVFANEALVTKAAPLYSMRGDRPTLPQAFLESLLDLRIINGTATMIVDNNRCIGCDDCVRACARAHDGNPRFIRHGSRHAQFMFANACMHCRDPVCLMDCPTGAIHRPPSERVVRIDDIACIGCGNCAQSCPYDNIRLVQIRDLKGESVVDKETLAPVMKATKCDLCLDQVTGPACQNACPHDALVRMDLSDRTALSDWVLKRI